MIQNAVFVLGAGASCPYGFPTGKELRQEILSRYIADYENYLRAHNAIEPLLQESHSKAGEFVNKFRKSTTPSIDLFLARNPEFSLEGKRSIIFRILFAERASHFREEMANRNQDWYSWLFEQMTNKLVQKQDYSRFSENNVSFITFNYDRSLEHFLYDSLTNSFNGIPKEKIIEQLNQIKICHVFGQMAPLEWQSNSGCIEYKIDINYVNVDALCDNIKIVYEGGDNPKLEEAQELISNAKRVYFLGFGYAEENLKALGIPEILEPVNRIEGTVFGFTTKEAAKVQDILAIRINNKTRRVYLKDRDCLLFLREVL